MRIKGVRRKEGSGSVLVPKTSGGLNVLKRKGPHAGWAALY